jgi:hypothetical protein
MSSLFLILLFGLIIWYWYNSLQANEIATKSARQTCQGQNLQFLDGTVVMHGIRISRSDAGHVCLKRTFQFEYSADYDSRKTGFVIMQGSRIETVGLED